MLRLGITGIYVNSGVTALVGLLAELTELWLWDWLALWF
jgi:hypothetical protein